MARKAIQSSGYWAFTASRSMRRTMIGAMLIGMAAVARSLGAATPLARGAVSNRTVEDVLREFGPRVEPQLRAACAKLRVEYPPHEVALVAMKAEKTLSVWVRNEAGRFKRLGVFAVLAASGHLGPKLKQGDHQVPEGVYRISGLNPNSRFHLSMKVDYPNAMDVAEAKKAGRTDLGGDIFIHGGAQSVGCLALGDDVIEKLFVLVARVGREHVRVVIAPQEPEGGAFQSPQARAYAWSAQLHEQILEALWTIRGRA